MNFTFGELLKGYRKRAGLTQQQLADNLRCGRTTIVGWENGRTTPEDREMVLKLKDELSLNASEANHLLRTAQFMSEYIEAPDRERAVIRHIEDNASPDQHTQGNTNYLTLLHMLDDILVYARESLDENQNVLYKFLIEPLRIDEVKERMMYMYYNQVNWGRFEEWFSFLNIFIDKSTNNDVCEILKDVVRLLDQLRLIFYSSASNLNECLREIQNLDQKTKGVLTYPHKRAMVDALTSRRAAIAEQHLRSVIEAYLNGLRALVADLGAAIGTIKGSI